MVHTYEYEGHYFAIDSESGSILKPDKISYEVLNAIIKKEDYFLLPYKKEQIDEVLTEIDRLRKEGEIFTEDNEAVFPKYSEINLKALCLHIAHDCNLQCSYCFGDKGSFFGKRELMSLNTAKQAIDYLISNSADRKNLEVDFFGGEPLINFNVLKEVINYARSREAECNKTFHFTVTTNAYHITDEMLELFLKEIKNVVISIDGREEVHNAHRKTLNGSGSYDKIIENAKRIVRSRGDKEYYVRGTYTKSNLDFTKDVQSLYEHGFYNISLEPVVSKREMGITEEDIPAVLSEYLILGRFLKKHPEINFFHFNVDLDSGPCLLKRIRGCGAGLEYLAVTPNGEIYPCHQFVGNPEFLMGNLKEGIKNHSIADDFADINIFKKHECINCWAKYYCSGGCAAAAYNMGGGIDRHYEVGCIIQRKRLEIAIAKQFI